MISIYWGIWYLLDHTIKIHANSQRRQWRQLDPSFYYQITVADLDTWHLLSDRCSTTYAAPKFDRRPPLLLLTQAADCLTLSGVLLEPVQPRDLTAAKSRAA